MMMQLLIALAALAAPLYPKPNFSISSPKADPETPIVTVKSETLPSEYNPIGSDPCLPTILNQGQCGSCYAFASSYALAHRTCKLYNSTFVPNPTELITCDTANNGCDGGDPSFSFRYIADYGLSISTCNPYNTSKTSATQLGGCNFNMCGSQLVTEKYYCKKGSAMRYDDLTINNEDLLTNLIKEEVYTKGAVVSSIKSQDSNAVFTNFKTSNFSTILSSDSTGETDHAVAIIGWGSNYWIIANSWSTEWGYQGYAKVSTGIRKLGKDAYFCDPLL